MTTLCMGSDKAKTMQSNHPLNTLTLAAADLARVAPEHWRKFVQALGAVAEMQRVSMMNSPSDTVILNQGKAQMGQAFFEAMTNAVDNAEKLKGKS